MLHSRSKDCYRQRAVSESLNASECRSTDIKWLIRHHAYSPKTHISFTVELLFEDTAVYRCSMRHQQQERPYCSNGFLFVVEVEAACQKVMVNHKKSIYYQPIHLVFCECRVVYTCTVFLNGNVRMKDVIFIIRLN